VPLPEPGTLWYSAWGRTDTVEILPDGRLTQAVRVHALNFPDGDQPRLTIPLDLFERDFQPQARISLEWLNRGSVWRRIPMPSYRGPLTDEGRHASATDCVVLQSISGGGICEILEVQSDGQLGAVGGIFGSRPTPFNLMHSYARVWPAYLRTPMLPTPLPILADPGDSALLYPAVLYSSELLDPEPEPEPEPRPTPTQSAVERVLQAAREQGASEFDQACAVAAAIGSGDIPLSLPKKKAKKSKKAKKAKTRWERMLEDDD